MTIQKEIMNDVIRQTDLDISRAMQDQVEQIIKTHLSNAIDNAQNELEFVMDDRLDLFRYQISDHIELGDH